MNTTRRHLLRALGALATTPVWAGTALAGSRDDLAELDVLTQAWLQAVQDAQPLLVLVGHPDAEEREFRSLVLGAWLNHGSDEAMVALSRVRLVAAHARAVATLLPEVARRRHVPWLVLVVPGDTAELRCIDLPLEPQNLWYRAFEERDATIDEWLDAAEDQVLRALHQELGAQDLPAVEQAVAAARVRQQLASERVDGAAWGVQYGCGAWVEDDRSFGFGCGMGHVPLRVTRFLVFREDGLWRDR